MRLHDSRLPDLAPALVLLCVKSGATAASAEQLAARLRAGTLVLSLQNGVINAGSRPAARAGAARAARHGALQRGRVAAGSFPSRHRTGTGRAGRSGASALGAAASQAPGCRFRLHADLRALQWGKLLLNLNNPVNALSGLPLRAQLLDRDLRHCSAALIEETLAVLKAAGVEPQRITPVAPRLLPRLLRLPTPVFRLLASRMLRIDAQARSSMADDLRLGHTTEIDALCGEVCRLALGLGHTAPLNARMVELIGTHTGGARLMDGATLRRALGV